MLIINKSNFHFSGNAFTFQPKVGESVKGNVFKLDLSDVHSSKKSTVTDYIKQHYLVISESDLNIRFFTSEIYLKDLKNMEQSARTREVLKSFLVEDFIEKFLKDFSKG